jgi:hypothetical protein
VNTPDNSAQRGAAPCTEQRAAAAFVIGLHFLTQFNS